MQILRRMFRQGTSRVSEFLAFLFNFNYLKMKVNRKTGEWISSAIPNLSSDTLPHSAKLFLNPKNLNSVQAPKMLNLGDQSVIGS